MKYHVMEAPEIIVEHQRRNPQGRSINRRMPSGDTLLIALIEAGDTTLVNHVILQGAEVNKANAVGVTPLETAVRAGSTELVELLLSNGAYVNYAGRFGFSPLQVALCKEDEAMVELLLRHGAYPSGIADRGPVSSITTPAINLALQCGNRALLQILLSNGAVTMDSGVIAMAIQSEIPDAIDMILNSLTKILDKVPDSCSLLSIAAMKHDCRIVKLLLAHGVKVEFEDGYISGKKSNKHTSVGNTLPAKYTPPIAACIHRGCRKCFDILLKAVSSKENDINENINYVDQLGNNSLTYVLLDTQWSCYRTSARQGEPCRHQHNVSKTCALRHSGQFLCALSTTHLQWTEDLLLRGADINSIFCNHHLALDKHSLASKNESALHLCIRASQQANPNENSEPSSIAREAKLVQLFRILGLTSDFKGLLLMYLRGYDSSEDELQSFSKGVSNIEKQEKIKDCLDLLTSTPRTLQNMAVISIRTALGLGSRGRGGNILYAAAPLQVPAALRKRITLESLGGLVCKQILEAVYKIHRIGK